MNYIPAISDTTVRTGTIEVQGLNIFYREAGKPGNPKLVLLHGFPASSHQYRNLIPALAAQVPCHRDGLSRLRQQRHAGSDEYSYTFDKTSEVVEGLLKQERLHPLRSLRAGLRRAGGLPHPRAPPGLAGVADRPEHQRL